MLYSDESMYTEYTERMVIKEWVMREEERKRGKEEKRREVGENMANVYVAVRAFLGMMREHKWKEQTVYIVAFQNRKE